MELPFFYESFLQFDQIQLSENSIHHILHVLRMKIGERFIVTNGNGLKSLVEISAVSKKNCEIKIIKNDIVENSTTPFHLAISFTKNPARIEWLLEKVTEIGISTITPIISKRSEKIFTKKERFEKIMISAMLQSQQTFLPILNEPLLFEEILASSEEIKLIAHCVENDKKEIRALLQKEKSAIVLIGPEGDFTSEEIEMALKNNFKPVSLGEKRLRTETAGLYACVVFNSL